MSAETKKPPAQYILVRADLPLFVQMVHACHASSEAVRVVPVDPTTHIRLLHVTNEAELLKYSEELTCKGHAHRLIREPDLYVPGSHFAAEDLNGPAMALATDPASGRVGALAKIFWHLKKASEKPAPVAQCRAPATKPEVDCSTQSGGSKT